MGNSRGDRGVGGRNCELEGMQAPDLGGETDMTRIHFVKKTSGEHIKGHFNSRTQTLDKSDRAWAGNGNS